LFVAAIFIGKLLPVYGWILFSRAGQKKIGPCGLRLPTGFIMIKELEPWNLGSFDGSFFYWTLFLRIWGNIVLF